MRPLNFAIIDEADYVLIDEAQQPLIMSTPLVDDWEVMQERLRVGDAIAQQLIADDALLTAGPPPGGDYPQEEVVFREAVQRGMLGTLLDSVCGYALWQRPVVLGLCCAKCVRWKHALVMGCVAHKSMLVCPASWCTCTSQACMHATLSGWTLSMGPTTATCAPTTCSRRALI